ncbi:translation elongation factor 2 [Encephalitozoon intestinalis ATCC 50506]|uniref:Elongation factor 2 n=1 Tax=Encephalitozoon intestinalis (strain ATCC 50506) TaxID=876142 RepID=E0SA12_ENCIT|nr:translation elongation factor 2 [Encephalitozoon intestinalis ATCC 50506]ADM12634.1 translation elongation factor 2 [Encephalitozoon intestinalis ATCC 50506]UTX46494.1 translation elongation factor 2 [Encephalitozoon intestinalis]
MVDFHISKVHELMTNQKNIRNISVIAHVDHGKSTLTDCLVIKAKIVSKDSGGGRYMDSREDEQQRGITIKSSAISLHFQIEKDVLEAYTKKEDTNGTEFLINLIDSPGHMDFSSEVTAALRVTDGALVVVDCVDGICVQTETVLGQAMGERIIPTLVLNKLDRAILELEYPQEKLGEVLRRRVEGFNAKLSTLGYNFKVESLMPEKNDISFCSGLQGWGFTLRHFARFYLEKFNMSGFEGEKKLTNFLWSHKVSCTSDDPFDPNIKHIAKPNPARSPFVVYVLNPIYKVKDFCNNGQIEEIKEYLKFYKVDFKGVTLTGSGKSLFKEVMKAWLPAADCILEQIALKLPSPLQSQKLRYDYLYEGPKDDEVGTAIMNCDASEEAPVTMYVSKMISSNDNRFIAFGRVFSGKIYPGMKIRVQEPGYTPLPEDSEGSPLLHIKSVLRTVVMMGRGYKDVPNCPAGNIIGIVGVDDCLKKTGTITNRKDSYNIRSMKFSVSPVVKVAVSTKRPEDLGKLQEGLKKLAQSDPLCLVERNDKGQNTIACAGSLHLEICLKDLQDQYAKVPIISEDPLVTYFEGISSSITEPKMTKSANKHNRIYMTVEPLEEKIVDNLNDVKSDQIKTMTTNFREMLDIRDDWIKKIWCYAPEINPLNLLVDGTKGISIINEIKEHVNTGFRAAVNDGPLIGEVMRGLKFELKDAVLHADAIHRGINQLLQPVKSLCKGLLLAATPILYEPIYEVEITSPNDFSGAATTILLSKRGTAEDFKTLPGNDTTMITGTLPVRESFTFNEDLKSRTGGKAGASMRFSHYSILPGSLDDPNSLMFKTVETVRKLKKMNPEPPTADSFFDKL